MSLFSCCKSLSATSAFTRRAIILGGHNNLLFFFFFYTKNAKVVVLIKKHLYLIAFVTVPINQTVPNYAPISDFFLQSAFSVSKSSVIQNNRFCSCLLLVWETTASATQGFIYRGALFNVNSS